MNSLTSALRDVPIPVGGYPRSDFEEFRTNGAAGAFRDR